MSERDKIEPQWSREDSVRPGREAKRKKAKSRGRTSEAAPPQEPSFAATTRDTPATVARLVSDVEPESHEVPTPAPSPSAPMAEGATVASSPEPATAPEHEASPVEAVPVPPAAEPWIELSVAQASRHRLYGVGGGLLAVAFLVALGLAQGVVETIDFWETTDHGGIAAWIMVVLRAGMVLWAILVLGLLFGRSRAFPGNFAAYSTMNIIYLALFGLAFAHVTDNTVFYGVAAAMAATAVALSYVLYSARVNVTYRRRVRAKRERPARAAASA